MRPNVYVLCIYFSRGEPLTHRVCVHDVCLLDTNGETLCERDVNQLSGTSTTTHVESLLAPHLAWLH